MGIIQLLVIICVIGVVVYLLTTYVPMGPGFKKAVAVVGILFVILLCLWAFGIFPVHDMAVPQIQTR